MLDVLKKYDTGTRSEESQDPIGEAQPAWYLLKEVGSTSAFTLHCKAITLQASDRTD